MTAPLSRPRRALRLLRRVAFSTLAVALVLSLAVEAIVLTPFGRSRVAEQVTRVLAPLFRGSIVIDRVAGLSLFGAHGIDAHVQDPEGAKVIVAHGLSARIDQLALLSSLLTRRAPLQIALSDVTCDDVEVNLDTNASGTLRLVSAFEPRPAPSALPAARPQANEGVFRLAIASLALRRVSASGLPSGSSAEFASATSVTGTLICTENMLDADITHARATLRESVARRDTVGELHGHLTLPGPGRPLVADAAFDGSYGTTSLTTRGHLIGPRLRASVVAPNVAPEDLSAIAPGVWIYAPVSLSVEADGELSAMAIRAALQIGDGAVQVLGEMSLLDGFRATFDVQADHIDLRSFVRAAPASSVNLSATGSLGGDGSGSFGALFGLDVQPSDIGGEAVPSTHLHGHVTLPHTTRGTASEVEIDATGLADEPGAPTELQIALRAGGPTPTLRVSAKSRVADLHKVTRIGAGPLLGGEARVTTDATLSFGSSPNVQGRVRIEGSNLTYRGIRVSRGEATVSARGSLVNPECDAVVDAQEVAVGGRSFRELRATSTGRARSPRVTLSLRNEDGAIDASAALDLESGFAAHHLQARISRGEKSLVSQAESVRVGDGTLDILGASIRGAGEPLTFDLHRARDQVTLLGSSKGLELKTIAYVLGEDGALQDGTLAFTATLAARPTSLLGSVTVNLHGFALRGLPVTDVILDSRLDGRRATGSVVATLGAVGRASFTDADVTLAGRDPLLLASWRNAFGKVTFDADIDLGKLEEILPHGTGAVQRGRLLAKGHIEREEGGGDLPAITLSAQTRGLTFDDAKPLGPVPSAPPSGATARQPVVEGIVVSESVWGSSGVDVSVDLVAAPKTRSLRLDTSLVDREGLVTHLLLTSSNVPYEQLLDGTSDRVQLLQSIPFAAKAELPRRALDHLPLAVRPTGVSGFAGGTFEVAGTGLDPSISLRIQGDGLRTSASDVTLRADLRGDYRAGNGGITIDVLGEKEAAMQAQIDFSANLQEFLLHPAQMGPWSASGRATLTQFPLATAKLLRDREIDGTVSGELVVTDFHKDVRAHGALHMSDLSIGAAKFPSMDVTGEVTADAAATEVHVVGEGGDATATARIVTAWGARLAPSWGEVQALRATLLAHHLRAAALLPFAEPVVSNLDGYLDADAQLTMATGTRPKLEGSATFRDGVVRLTQLGEEFHGVGGKITLAPEGIVRIDDVVAEGTAGRLTAAGTAQLDGLSIQAAKGKITIPKSAPIAFQVQGTALGSVYGDVEVKGSSSANPEHLDLEVAIPHLHVALPLSASHFAEELSEPERTHIGVFRDPEHFVVVPMAGADVAHVDAVPVASKSTIDVAVHLGDDVEVVRGTQVKVGLGGDVTIRVQSRTTVRGQITLLTGHLQVQGRNFTIEKGTVAFVGDDPSNPQVAVTAGWTAGDGTRVYADFIGPLRTGTVTLRSEPARPKSEIVTLLVFGSADGSAATPYTSTQGSAAVRAGAMAGGLATEGLNNGITRLTGVDIATSIDTTSSSSPRPEVEVQIAKDVSIELAFVLGTPPPGTNPDHTYATIDWRFLPNWSLATTFGDLGSSFAQLVWHYRY